MRPSPKREEKGAAATDGEGAEAAERIDRSLPTGRRGAKHGLD